MKSVVKWKARPIRYHYEEDKTRYEDSIMEY